MTKDSGALGGYEWVERSLASCRRAAVMAVRRSDLDGQLGERCHDK